MKYTIICFTFNKKEAKDTITGEYLTLRNNWIDKVHTIEDLLQNLDSLGFTHNKLQDVAFKIATGDIVKVSGDFTIENTRIIVHIIKN